MLTDKIEGPESHDERSTGRRLMCDRDTTTDEASLDVQNPRNTDRIVVEKQRTKEVPKNELSSHR